MNTTLVRTSDDGALGRVVMRPGGRVEIEAVRETEERWEDGWRGKCVEVGEGWLRLWREDGCVCCVRLGRGTFRGAAVQYAQMAYVGRWLELARTRIDVLRHPTGHDEPPRPATDAVAGLAGGGTGPDMSLQLSEDADGYKRWQLVPPPRPRYRVGR
jgi:hypothetical protein